MIHLPVTIQRAIGKSIKTIVHIEIKELKKQLKEQGYKVSIRKK